MTKLELTIIQAARSELHMMRAGDAQDAQDRAAAMSAWSSIMAFVMLAHIHDSGLSEDAISQLLAIEIEASQALLALPELETEIL